MEIPVVVVIHNEKTNKTPSPRKTKPFILPPPTPTTSRLRAIIKGSSDDLEEIHEVDVEKQTHIQRKLPLKTKTQSNDKEVEKIGYLDVVRWNPRYLMSACGVLKMLQFFMGVVLVSFEDTPLSMHIMNVGMTTHCCYIIWMHILSLDKNVDDEGRRHVLLIKIELCSALTWMFALPVMSTCLFYFQKINLLTQIFSVLLGVSCAVETLLIPDTWKDVRRNVPLA